MGDSEVVHCVVPKPPLGVTISLSAIGGLCQVESVEDGSRAQASGVQVGDVLLSANGAPPPVDLESEAALVRFFRSLSYPMSLAFARRTSHGDATFRAALRQAEADTAKTFVHSAPPPRTPRSPPPPRARTALEALPAGAAAAAAALSAVSAAKMSSFAAAFNELSGESPRVGPGGSPTRASAGENPCAGDAVKRAVELAHRPLAPLQNHAAARDYDEIEDPILAETRAMGRRGGSDGHKPQRGLIADKPLRGGGHRRDEAITAEAEESRLMQLWNVRFGLGYAYFRLQFVEDFERGFRRG
ncbi:hypothetical protein M885DRAFT_568153 [Pelagophyceae sp. CCMP2097]|nr:hypothetical protein M885DRAFT_568153 [Pelagophyceae sp. CCMP2097]